MAKYNPKKIEKKWAKYWIDRETFVPDLEKSKNPYYALFMFPYPSAEGLHIGNFYAFTSVDVMAKYMRLKGFDVYEPVGWDAFGIHSENYALKIGQSPEKMLQRTIKNFRHQLQTAGLSCDWTREVNTTDPEYYKWTQWIFTKLFEKGLAYQKEALVNWCPDCKTVLADEQIEAEGVCERCKATVEKRKMKQWFFKITAYAERLLDGLETMDWSEITKSAQRNWIGKSEGTRIKFPLVIASPSKGWINSAKQSRGDKDCSGSSRPFGSRDDNFIEVFTTRTDTLFGCTYVVLSPEHKLSLKIATSEKRKEVEKYIKKSCQKSEMDRKESKVKTGVFTGAFAVNPVNNEKVPIWVADYVLAGYGTGAVMAVPAHDERDFEFAKKYKLAIKQSIAPNFENYKKTLKTLEVLQGVNGAAKKENLKIWLLGGLGCAFHAGIIYRSHEDLDLIVKDNKQLQKAIKIFEKLGFKKIKEKKISEKLTNYIFADKNGIEIDIGPNVGEWGLLNKDFEEDIKVLNGCDAYALSKKFHINLKEFLQKKRNKEKDNIDLVYLAGKVFVEDGFLVNSGKYSGLASEKARAEITKWLEKNKLGQRETNYKLRDWCISRQRYWGPPIPIVYCEKCAAVAVPEKDLPVKLPEMKKGWEPAGDGKGPLAKVESFVKTKCPKCGGEARREADVMDNFLDSAWYFFRYVSPKDKKEIFDKKLGKKWLPVDLYVGGNEHAVLHLMYTRFVTMTLHDLGLTDFDNPFKKFRANGMILKDGKKMSKSKGNVVNPEEYGDKLGYDALKSYLLFLGPLSEDRSFSDEGIRGLRHWAERVFNLKARVFPSHKDEKIVIKKLQQTISAVENDMDNQKYNTAIAKLMELTNTFYGAQKVSTKTFEKYLIIASIFLPALVEELWHKLGHKKSIFLEKWPKFDQKLVVEKEANIVIQVNGKVRGQIQVAADAKEDEIKRLAFESEKIKKYIPNPDIIRKIIFVPGRLINFVV